MKYQFTPISPLALPEGAQTHAGLPAVQAAHDRMRDADEAWRAARALGQDDEALRGLVSAYINTVYEYQKARYGSVKMRLSVGSILR